MKDYARNNFKQKSQDVSKKQAGKQPKKIRIKRKRLILYTACALAAILALLSWALSPSINKQKPITSAVQPNINETNINSRPKSILKTPDVFQTKSQDNNSQAAIPESIENKNKSTTQPANKLVSDDIHTSTIIDPKKSETNIDKTEPKFTFYKNLSSQTVETDVVANKAKKYIYTYMLQVGSYKNTKAVNAMRARLLLIGLKPQVSRHGNWYRIDIGPVYSKRDGDILKHKLEAAKISGSMLRQVSKKEAPADDTLAKPAT